MTQGKVEIYKQSLYKKTLYKATSMNKYDLKVTDC